MIRSKLFRRHFTITAIVLITFIVFGFFISNVVVRAVMNRQMSPFGAGPISLFARWIDDINPRDRVQALKHIEQSLDPNFLDKFFVLDESGKNLSTGALLPLAWRMIKKPERPYEYLAVDQGPHSGSGPENGLIRFPGQPSQYLYSLHDPKGESPFGPPPTFIFIVTVGSLLLSVFAGVGFALFLLFRSMREKMELADTVITDLQHGNLKARFPVHRMDELGQIMSRFNKMADEIERLVEQLKKIEKSRMTLLQDLTHDLRTPVASLKNLLATVEKKNNPMDLAIRSELLSLSRKEVSYFERLLEDLLVLAQVSDPHYHGEQESVSLLDLLENEELSVENKTNHLRESIEKTIEIQTQLSSESSQIVGDPLLLQRMIRNALENAFSFAKSKVTILVDWNDDDSLKLLIQDDGPGLSEAALQGFGERRVSRVIENRLKDERVSLGLGSVIMKTVAEMHRGSITAKNRVSSSGQILGAEILIILPIKF